MVENITIFGKFLMGDYGQYGGKGDALCVVESFNSQDRIQCDGLTSSDRFRDFLACLRLFEVSCVVFFSIL